MEMPVGVGLKMSRSEVSCSAIQQQQANNIRRRSAAARLLGLRFRIPLRAWVFVSCVFVCCVGGGLCDEIIIRSEKSTVCVCV
jgi:hypothetical protein